MKRIPILCYHRVHLDDDPQMPEVVPGEYCGHVTRSVFKRQMAALAEGGFSAVTHRELAEWLHGRGGMPAGKTAAIDFDDNRQNVFENAFPVIEQYGFKGTVFVVARLADGDLPGMQEFPAMRWDELRLLRDAGWTIGAHTLTHRPLDEVYAEAGGPAEVERELAGCREEIDRRLGVEADSFAYPGGGWNEKVEAIVRRHYCTARLWSHDFRAAYNTSETDPYRLVPVNVNMLTTEQEFRQVLAGAQ